MNDIWTNRLSEYIDGELDTAERAALETHLKTCGACYATLGELRDVVARAKTLEDRAPAKDLWAGIRAGMTPAHGAGVSQRAPAPRRRFAFTMPQLLAASIALVLLSSGGAWLAVGSRKPVTPAPTLSETNKSTYRPVSWTNETDNAITDLQAALAQNESKLDTTTVRIVRQNLAIIDRAIADARIALQKDPGNAYLNLHLANTMRRKVELLRRVNDIAAQS